MGRALHLAVMSLLVVLGTPVVLLASLVKPALRRGLAERLSLARPSPPSGRSVWIHAASIGEMRLAAELGRRLVSTIPDLQILVTTNTVAGREEAARSGHQAHFAPLDHPLVVGRFLDAARPRALVVVETELWPFWMDVVRRRRIPALLVNGRLSATALGRYRFAAPRFRETLLGFSRLLMRSREDLENVRALGADPGRLLLLGDLKAALGEAPAAERVAALRARYRIAPDEPVLVAGSTDVGEEEIAIDAWEAARARHGTLRLILAPRQPDRFEAGYRTLLRRDPRATRATAVAAGGVASSLLLDRMGELCLHYALADVAFVGGSFTERGGQNLLEPARLGVPVLHGPRVANWEEAARRLEAAGGSRRCASAAMLRDEVVALLDDPERRREMGRAARSAAEEGDASWEVAVREVAQLLGEAPVAA